MSKRLDSFVIFSAQKEIPAGKMSFETNSLVEYFKDVKSISDFKELKLPLVQTMAVKEADKWSTSHHNGELHYQELGDMRRGIGNKAAYELLNSLDENSVEGVVCEINATAAYKMIKRNYSMEKRNKLPEAEHMLPVLWAKLTCKGGNS
jgi:hypothetical protein